jgi:fido (protein-threonine AMPylation protein)
MDRIERGQWPEVVFVGDLSRAALSRAATEGRAIRLGPGIYSGRPSAKPEDVVRRNWAQIIDHELPGAIITDRSARLAVPANGLLTVVHSRKRPLELPGLTILPRLGVGHLPGDSPMSSVWVASQSRALLENLRGAHQRYLTRGEIEAWIADILTSGGDSRLNYVRDEARKLAEIAGWQAEFGRLNAIIGAALSTQSVDILQTEALRSRAAGTPFDRRRLELFEHLAQALQDIPFEPPPLLAQDADRRRLLPFYEAYFSNYIEGTEFTLDEAASIVFEQRDTTGRPEDAHDILGTYRIVSDTVDMARTPKDAIDFVGILQERHRGLMEARPDKRPGQFKERANRAGSTVFVAPELVEETLRRGFDAGQELLSPFARAVYMGFVVSEVHPFDDGNGRISRMTMNAELSHAGEGRIIIPTVYRNNYLSALKAASINANFESLAATLQFAQRYTARVDFSSRSAAESDLARTNALREANEADAIGIRLQLPS